MILDLGRKVREEERVASDTGRVSKASGTQVRVGEGCSCDRNGSSR